MMKYEHLGQIIPQDRRKALNEKILYMIDNDLAEESGITQEDVYNAYTGDGGLHGLKLSDYGSYYEFSRAKQEIENGQFFTPHAVCKFVMDCLAVEKSDIIADLTCGMGGFFNFAPAESSVYGCELDVKAYKVAKYLYPKANITMGDIRSYEPGIKFDYVVGNPPFNLRWWVDGEQILSQLYYCQKAAQLLKPYGIMALVVPGSFLADDFSDKHLISEMEERFFFLGQLPLDQDVFSNLGVVGYHTKIQFWQKRPIESDMSSGKYSLDTSLRVNLDGSGVRTVRNLFVEKAQQTLKKNRTHILLELARDRMTSEDFQYKVKKYLYAIQAHPALREKYVKCCEYINKFYTQQKPDGMSYEEWAKVRITEAKVLAYLKRIVSNQHPKQYRDEIKLIKRDGEFVYKAYSPKTARQLTDSLKKPTPIYDVVVENHNPSMYGQFARMIRRRQREYQIENQQFSEMSMDESIAEWLNAFTLYDSENEEWLHLNNLQKQDLNHVLQKKYTLLQWEQGTGKTLAGISTGQYRMQNCGSYCTWVISSAISIKNNWDIVLQNYGLSYVMVERLVDLQKIKKGDFVIMTLDMLCKYQRQVKRWVRIHNQKIALCFDESDEISNPSSKRTKAVLSVFRRVKHKLLMTGTSTRNNISEAAPQIELAYNCSVNMISWCETIYHIEKPSKKNGFDKETLVSDWNENYGRPIPPYTRGYALFSASHLPEKITVFGVAKKNQDIYNAEVLDELLGKFVITRSFKEVTGKDIIRIHQVPVRFATEERVVYQKAIEAFHEMCGNYFASTGNSRKDSMMRLIQQITLLLRITAAPSTLKEYEGGTPTKIAKVIEMLQEMDDQVVAIGVRHINVVNAYASVIRKLMPDRPLFIVTGSTTTLAKRRALRKTLRDSGNGILLCTQQSLPSSVNFEFVDKVIIPELHYNNSRMSQFYFRFIRYTSTHMKDVYFVTYLGSIESNQMQMVLAKEKLNLFMRGENTDLDEIYERFGVDYDLLSALMSREMDENGKFHIRWGEQTVVQ